MKYSYKCHSTIPSELINVKSIVENADTIQKTYINRCKKYHRSQLSKNMRHHFIYDEKMGIKQVIEFENKWINNPSKYFVIRDFIYKGERVIEHSELYCCRDCEVYCWSNNRHIQPYEVYELTSRKRT